MLKNTRCRKYFLTINNPIEKGVTHNIIKQTLEESRITVKYCAVCDETGNLGTYHFHILLIFENAVRFSTVKRLFPEANIQPTQGTAAQGRSYLRKDGINHHKDANGFYEYQDSAGKTHSGQNHTNTFEEWGTLPKEHQGSRSDLEYFYSLIKEGYSNIEIMDMIPLTAIPHLEKMNKIRHDYLVDKYKNMRRTDLQVNYITGATGAGKSRDILDYHGDENVFRVTDYQHPFDSYQQQPVIVFEEFRSSLRLQDMLNYLDIYPVELPARYVPKIACYETVYVVSNWSFEMQYSEIQKDWGQQSTYNAWVRRFNGYVKEYTGDQRKNIVYPTMQDYLNRFQKIPKGVKTSFDDSSETADYQQEELPFEN